MPKTLKTYFALILILIVFILTVSTYALNIPARPLNYVTDLAELIPPEKERQINNLLKNLESKTTAQIFIITIKSLEGNSIEAFSISVAERWKPGQKGKDNGVLITVALKERAYRIEVGYGLEGILPDSLVGTIGRKLLVPHFREGNYAQGLFEASKEIALIITQNQGIELDELKGQKRQTSLVKEENSNSLIDTLIIIVLVIIVVLLFIFRPDLLMLILFSSGRGSWSGGGGFGGGGGGSFGGGGASGRW